jgi:hypothetical protein
MESVEDNESKYFICVSLSTTDYKSHYPSGSGFALLLKTDLKNAAIINFDHCSCSETWQLEDYYNYGEDAFGLESDIIYSGEIHDIIKIMSENKDLRLIDRVIIPEDNDYKMISAFYKLVLEWYSSSNLSFNETIELYYCYNYNIEDNSYKKKIVEMYLGTKDC